MNSIVLRSLHSDDWTDVSRIYADGIATGLATFETKVPDWNTWNKKYIDSCRLVAEIDGQVVGFAVLSKVSKREVYKGVAEVSLYIDKGFRGQGLGKVLLNKLIEASEAAGFWTLQAGIFSKNSVSIALYEHCGFRIVGVREKIGKLNGVWHDNHFLERRSKKII